MSWVCAMILIAFSTSSWSFTALGATGGFPQGSNYTRDVLLSIARVFTC